MGGVVHSARGVPPSSASEVVAQLRVDLIERGLHGAVARSQEGPGSCLHGDRSGLGEDERLAPRQVEVRAEDLRLPWASADIAHEQLIGLERGLGSEASGALGGLAHHQLEGLVAAEEDLLGVAIRPRVRELALEAQEDAEPALIAGGGHLGGDAH
jgi:hypothetical protein